MYFCHFIVKHLELKVILTPCKWMALVNTEYVGKMCLWRHFCLFLLCTAFHVVLLDANADVNWALCSPEGGGDCGFFLIYLKWCMFEKCFVSRALTWFRGSKSPKECHFCTAHGTNVSPSTLGPAHPPNQGFHNFWNFPTHSYIKS